MTIASELIDLQTNLAAAKAAVTTAGGTVGDTGLAGLATEIATIPTSGGVADFPVVPTDYGVLYSYPMIVNWQYQNVYQSQLISFDADKFAEWVANNNLEGNNTISFSVNIPVGDGWAVNSGTYQEIPFDQMKATTGLEVDALSMDASFNMTKTVTIDPTGKVQAVVLASQTDLNTLGQQYGDYTRTINGQTIDIRAVVRFDFGTQSATVPAYFLKDFSSLEVVNTASWITSIPNGFLQNCSSFNSPLDLSNAATIGDYFLRSADSFNNQIILSNSLASIGTWFLFGCNNFNQNITFPSTLQSVGKGCLAIGAMTSTITVECPASVFAADQSGDRYAFSAYSETDPAYVSGMKVAGTYANDLKIRFPDVATRAYGYRKLVLASS